MSSTTLNTNTTAATVIGVTIGFEKKVRVSVWRTLGKKKRRETLCCTLFEKKKKSAAR